MHVDDLPSIRTKSSIINCDNAVMDNEATYKIYSSSVTAQSWSGSWWIRSLLQEYWTLDTHILFSHL